MNYMTMLRAKPGVDRLAFRDRLAAQYTVEPTETFPGCDRVTLFIADGNSPITGPGQDSSDAYYDAVFEMWTDEPAARLGGLSVLKEQAELTTLVFEERVRKDVRGWEPVGKSPGCALLCFCIAPAGQARATTLRHWTEHAPLALRIHHGMTRYIQNVVLPGSDDTAWFGMSHLHFPRAETIPADMYRSEADQAVIGADVADFVAEAVIIRATEYVLKG